MTVFEKIAQQQEVRQGTPAFFVGEQLKEICYADSHCAEIVSQDLDSESMSLEKAAEKIKAYADEKHRKDKGSFVCVPPDVAEGIIREFYGLPAAAPEEKEPPVEEPAPVVPDLFSFF